MITPSHHPLSDWSTPARSDWVIRERIAYERVAAMIVATAFPMAVGLAFALACAVVLLRVADATVVAGWLLLLGGLSAVRLLQVRRFRADPQRRARADHWERRYLMLLLPYGLAWSTMLAIAGPRISGFVFSFVIVGLLGVASVGVYTLHGVFRAAVVWVLSIMLPVAAWCLWRADLDGVVLAFGALLFTAAMLYESHRSSRLQTEMLRLRLENAAIADDRARALALAEQSNRAKTRFLATVSHEMRTPLNGIVGMSELLRDAAPDAQVRQRADHVLRSAEQLHRVIGDLLDLSRLEFGRLALDPAPFDPAQALREVLALAAPQAAERGLQLDMALDPALPRYVAADAARVKQVLHSLLSNALQHTLAGRIEATLAPCPLGLRYTVTDTGPGIAPERLATLFEPFDDAGADADRRRQGIGLGLTISRRLARAMNGDLVCEARPGLGARFVFTLQAPVVSQPPPEPAADSPPPQLSGRVLVVDDNEVNALVAQAMLLRLGLASDIATDGEQALLQMARGVHDLVLMDCRMPTLDGWEATRRWRAHEDSPGVETRLPIIGVTANVSEADRQHCLQCGMDDFLPKPFRVQELATVLRPFLPDAATRGQSGG
jgi:signal transduction histidine kinase/CheY-like chemotaxis protein